MTEPHFMSEIVSHLLDLKSDVGGMKEIVERHDEDDLPEIKNTLVRMESKQNKDIAQFTATAEALEKRFKPIETEYNARQESKKEIKSKSKGIVWSMMEKGMYVLIAYVAGLWFGGK